MIKRYLVLFLLLLAAAATYGQSAPKRVKHAPKRVKQPHDVVAAYRVCAEFQRLLAENLDFDRAFEATFVKNPSRRRQVAIAESEHGDRDLAQVDTDTVVGSFKDQAQLIILLLPVIFAGGEDDQAKMFPAPIKAIFERKPPNDPQEFQAYAAQLKRDVTGFRAHFDKLAANNPAVAKNIEEYKKYLLTPLKPPNRIVQPMTAYSRGGVLRLDEEYYRIDQCAVIREDGQMRLIGYTFFTLRF